jgi:hypothetical protein
VQRPQEIAPALEIGGLRRHVKNLRRPEIA